MFFIHDFFLSACNNEVAHFELRSAVFGRIHGNGCTQAADSNQASDADDVDLDRVEFQANNSRVHNALDTAVMAGSCGYLEMKITD